MGNERRRVIFLMKKTVFGQAFSCANTEGLRDFSQKQEQKEWLLLLLLRRRGPGCPISFGRRSGAVFVLSIAVGRVVIVGGAGYERAVRL